MWHLYIAMAALAAGIVLKLVHPLMGRGRLKHADAVTKGDLRLLYATVGALPVLSLGIYLFLGSPHLPGQPATLARYDELAQQHLALLSVRPFETLVDKNPHDIGAIATLGQVNYRLGNFGMAARFFAQAAEEARLQNDLRERPMKIAQGEALVEEGQGVVTDAAAAVFAEVLVLHPPNPIARYYLALKKSQEGKHAEAIAEWESLLEGGYPEIYWKKRVREKIAETRKKL